MDKLRQSVGDKSTLTPTNQQYGCALPFSLSHTYIVVQQVFNLRVRINFAPNI